MHICQLTLTYNRDSCLQRALRFYIEQDYTGPSTMLIFNSGKETSIPEIIFNELPPNKHIILLNKAKNNRGEDYSSVGEKFKEALQKVKELVPEATVICHADVDDIFLKNYLSDGAKGMEKAYSLGKKAFKPRYSIFMDKYGAKLMENVFEPSIFVNITHLEKTGYFPVQVKFHDKWLHPLINRDEILVDETFPPGFMYDWSGELPVYKMSGRPDDKENFLDSQSRSFDFGEGVTYAISQEEADRYYMIANRALRGNG